MAGWAAQIAATAIFAAVVVTAVRVGAFALLFCLKLGESAG
ncbi:MAG TPA: hypothetical protein VLA64_15250 [Azonexus sp.]|nr:hypothetical protein [Azonexus sp.]